MTKVFDTERQDWAGSRHEHFFDTDRYLDLPRQRQVRNRTAIVLAAAGLCFGVWALGWKDEPQPSRDSSTGAAPGTTADEVLPQDTPLPSDATPTVDPALSALPDGYKVFVDSQGFHVALPTGWHRDSHASEYGIDVVDYRSPGGTRRLQVFQLKETSAYASLKEAQTYSEKLDGYQLINLGEVPDATGEAAEHEYHADEIAGEQGIGTTRHVIDRRFEAADGERYALVAYGDYEDGTTDERELLDTARAWFCPPGTPCASPPG